MKFICLGFMDETKWDGMSQSEQKSRLMEQCFAYDAERGFAAGWAFSGGEAAPDGPEMRRPCRYRDGRVFVTDGPFAETKERLGGILLTGSPLI